MQSEIGKAIVSGTATEKHFEALFEKLRWFVVVITEEDLSPVCCFIIGTPTAYRAREIVQALHPRHVHRALIEHTLMKELENSSLDFYIDVFDRKPGTNGVSHNDMPKPLLAGWAHVKDPKKLAEHSNSQHDTRVRVAKKRRGRMIRG